MSIISGDYYSYARNGSVSFTAFMPVETPPFPQFADEPRYKGHAMRSLYFLHGYSANRNEMITNMRIRDWAGLHNIAVFMPDGANNFWIDNEERNENYGEFVGREFIDFTRKAFNLSDKREDTFIAGISMGGYGAIVNGLKYHDVFSKIIALSPALITDEISKLSPGDSNPVAGYGYYRSTFGELTKLLGSDRDPKHLADAALVSGNAPKLFLTCGTEDFLYSQNVDFHEHLTKIGYKHTWHTAPGNHDYDYWNSVIEPGLKDI